MDVVLANVDVPHVSLSKEVVSRLMSLVTVGERAVARAGKAEAPSELATLQVDVHMVAGATYAVRAVSSILCVSEDKVVECMRNIHAINLSLQTLAAGVQPRPVVEGCQSMEMSILALGVFKSGHSAVSMYVDSPSKNFLSYSNCVGDVFECVPHAFESARPNPA